MALYQVRFVPLKTTLANLPPTLYSPLVAAQKVPTLRLPCPELP